MSQSFQVSIKPDVLRWARDSLSLAVEEVASKIKKTPEDINRWEQSGQHVPYSVLENLSKLYKRPVAAFFLPVSPSEPNVPPDKRVLPGMFAPAFSRDTLLAIRSARRVRRITVELTMGEKAFLAPARLTRANVESCAAKCRLLMGIDVKRQMKMKSPSDAFSTWRSLIEAQNIVVLQESLPLNEIRGLSIHDPQIPMILINSADAINARVFTLIHEYGHLLMGKEGICNPSLVPLRSNRGQMDSDGAEESICNSFAGAFLMPRREFESLFTDTILSDDKDAFDLGVHRASAKLKVSRYAALKRLYELGKIRYAKYKDKYGEWKIQDSKKARRTKGFVLPDVECISHKGKTFVSLVLEAKRKDAITLKDVSDYLGVRTKHIESIRKKVWR